MLKKIQSLFERVVSRVENNETPFSRYILLFTAILVLRLTLEFFSSRRLFTLDDILHIGLWFLFIVLAFMVQLQLFSGEKMLKVAKIVIVFFSISLTAPILDLIITKGIGAKMNYLSINSWDDVWWSYITIGGSSFSRGATPGIRLEIILLLIASLNYVRTKRKSWLLGIVSALSIYTVLFISGTIPFLLGLLVKGFHLQYQANDQSTLLLLLTLNVFLFLTAVFRFAPKHIGLICKKTPWGSVIIASLLVIIGCAMAIKNYPGNFFLTPTTLFWFPLLFMLALCFAGYTGILAINNDPGNNIRKYAGGGNILTVLMLVISCMISANTFFTTALLWSLLVLLYEPPLQLRKIPVLRNLLQAMALLAAAFIGFCTFNAPVIGFPVPLLWVILIGSFMSGFFTDISGHESSLFISIQSMRRQKMIITGLVLASFVLGYFVLYESNSTGFLFLFSSLPPLLTIWLKPQKPQFILFSFVPVFAILLITICM